MMVCENKNWPGYYPPRLLLFADEKAWQLYEYHEELQKIKKMSYNEFLELRGDPDEERYRFIYDEDSFLLFKKKSPGEIPIKSFLGMPCGQYYENGIGDLN